MHAASKMISAHYLSPSDCFTLLDQNNDPANPMQKCVSKAMKNPWDAIFVEKLVRRDEAAHEIDEFL